MQFIIMYCDSELNHTSVKMSFSKITQVFRRTIFPTHFVTRQIQRLQSLRPDLFYLPLSRTLKSLQDLDQEYRDLTQENKELSRENELLRNQLDALRKEKNPAEFQCKNLCSLSRLRS
jgi:hypothetical protein